MANKFIQLAQRTPDVILLKWATNDPKQFELNQYLIFLSEIARRCNSYSIPHRLRFYLALVRDLKADIRTRAAISHPGELSMDRFLAENTDWADELQFQEKLLFEVYQQLKSPTKD